MPDFEPEIIGRYAVYEKIAAGGMASVHFARLIDPTGFSRTVVVKRAHAHLAEEPDFALMFLDEARLAARIRHPNVVSTVDVLQTPTALLLVMDYIHGESLSKIARALRREGERIPLPIAAAIMEGTLRGLHAAHEATDERGAPLGIVHRDVSSQNILVGTDGLARLVDFGIAKAAGRLHSTKDSTVKGKYAYMAPEQARGEPVTRQTDIYAASIVFWEMLTGESLFTGRTDAETIHKALVGHVPPVRRFAPDVPASIEDIVMKGLARDPAERYAAARDMAEEIERCVAPVRPSEVGAWVERIVGAALSARAVTLARIEEASAPSDFRPKLDSKVDGKADGKVDSHDALVEGGATHEPPRRARLAWLLASGVLGFVAVAAWRGQSAHEAAPVLPLREDPVPALARPENAPLPAAKRPSSDTTSPSTPAPPPAEAPVPPPKERSAAHVAPQPSASPARPKRVRNCDPPYSIDSQGREIFKPECM